MIPSTAWGTDDLIAFTQAAHAHFNWYFTAPGDYQFKLTAVALFQNGEEVRGSGIVNVEVLPEPTALALLR